MLYMSERDYKKILEHCRRCLPNEACGLIAGTRSGDDKLIKKVYLLTNIDHSNEHFFMDVKEQLKAIKDMRANKLEMLGNFHSHPESSARPSEEDIRLAYDSNVDYLILSLKDKENPVLKAFCIDEEKNVTGDELYIAVCGNNSADVNLEGYYG